MTKQVLCKTVSGQKDMNSQDSTSQCFVISDTNSYKLTTWEEQGHKTKYSSTTNTKLLLNTWIFLLLLYSNQFWLEKDLKG